jgi:hypothetical protein
MKYPSLHIFVGWILIHYQVYALPFIEAPTATATPAVFPSPKPTEGDLFV